ncbi:MAG: hypothetical protein MUO77_04980, partial [Anaerolineales bacterium]|nr:hypothetical protein [Anaerolineales bacterium]
LGERSSRSLGKISLTSSARRKTRLPSVLGGDIPEGETKTTSSGKNGNLKSMLSTPRNIERVASYVDVLVGAVRISGARAPILVTRAMVQAMKPRSVILDLSIDEGGCMETSRPTTHDQPVYIEEGVLHYCVPNMGGATARTSTNALFNVGMPYILEIANMGSDAAIATNPALAFAVTTHAGQMQHLSRLTNGKES